MLELTSTVAALAVCWALGAATVALTGLSPRARPEPEAPWWWVALHRLTVGVVVVAAVSVVVLVVRVALLER